MIRTADPQSHNRNPKQHGHAQPTHAQLHDTSIAPRGANGTFPDITIPESGGGRVGAIGDTSRAGAPYNIYIRLC